MTATFETLKATSQEPTAAKQHWRNWISNGTWLLMRQCTLLRWAGQLRRTKGTHMQCAVHSTLKVDRAAQTAQVSNSIVANLAKGNVQEAFRHLKGWYQMATETQAKPCYLTMEKQMAERIDLYRQRDPPGDPIVVTVGPPEVWDDTPTNGEIWVAVVELTNGWAAGVFRDAHVEPEGVASGHQVGGRPGDGAKQRRRLLESPCQACLNHLGRRHDTHPTRMGYHSPHSKGWQGLSRHWSPRASVEGHRKGDGPPA